MTDLVVVADDLTGAMDTGHSFAKRGHETAVVAVPDAPETGVDTSATSVLAVNTDTRYAASAAARNAVERVVKRARDATVYKKVDSTLRGNVAAEVEAALVAADAELALFAPAFPATGRSTVDGIHRVDGDPVTETEYGEDRKGPPSAVLTELFADYGGPVESLPQSVVDAGCERVAAALDDLVASHEQAPIVCCDAASDTALSTISSAAKDFETVYAGSGGLAAHVAVPAPPTAPPETLTVDASAPLAVVGSASEQTLTQLAQLPEDMIAALDASAMLTAEWVPDVSAVIRRIREGKPAVVTAATDEETVRETLAIGRERGLSTTEIQERVATGLATAAAATLDAVHPSGMVLTGGDVAVATLRATNASTVRLTGTAIESGIPVGVVRDGDMIDLGLVTKAGGFGSQETVYECINYFSPLK